MTLTSNQIKFAFNLLVDEILKNGPMKFTKQDLKTAITDAETWAELTATKTDFNSALTAGNFKTNATGDEKRLALIFALHSIIRG